MFWKFICGCDMPSRDAFIGDPELKTLAMVTYDHEGHIICLAHGERRYGWRPSLTDQPNLQGQRRAYYGWTPLEIERYEVFGEERIPPTISYSPSQALDLRPDRLRLALDTRALQAVSTGERIQREFKKRNGSHAVS